MLWLRPYFWLNHPAKYGCVILGGTMSMPAQILPAAEIGATMDNRPPSSPSSRGTRFLFRLRRRFSSLPFRSVGKSDSEENEWRNNGRKRTKRSRTRRTEDDDSGARYSRRCVAPHIRLQCASFASRAELIGKRAE